MPTNSKYAKEIQKLGMGAEVILYQVDMTMLGGPILYLTPMTSEGSGSASDSDISFGGQSYDAFPIMAEGFEWISGQAPPQPSVSISNIQHALTSHVLAYGSLIGAKFTRIRTFDRFIDGGIEPDANACMPKDIYRFDKKTSHNEHTISWELASWVDQQGVMLPKRLVIRDYCSLRYRNGASGTFDYSKATCPYVGANRFDIQNNVVATNQADICAHTLKACRARFGQTADLPFGGFPGVAKFRTS